jgi:hypothetical protein
MEAVEYVLAAEMGQAGKSAYPITINGVYLHLRFMAAETQLELGNAEEDILEAE